MVAFNLSRGDTLYVAMSVDKVKFRIFKPSGVIWIETSQGPAVDRTIDQFQNDKGIEQIMVTAVRWSEREETDKTMIIYESG